MNKVWSTFSALFSKENIPLGALSMGHMFTHWYTASFFMVLPFLGKELGLTYTQIGFIITLRSLVSAVSNIPGGIIVDLLGKRIILMVLALVWVGLPYALIGVGGGYFAILFYIALIGAGSNLWHPAAVSEISERYKHKRGWAIGIHTMAANIGDLIGPIAAGALLGIFFWRQVLIINALPGLLAAVALWYLLKRYMHDNDAMDKIIKDDDSKGKKNNIFEYKENLKIFLKSKNVSLLLLLSGIRSFAQTSLMTFLPLYFINILSLSTVIAGFYMGLIQLGGSIAAPLSGYLSDKRGRKGLLSAGLLFSSLLLIALAVIRVQILFVVALSVLGFALFSLRPVVLAWLMDESPKGTRGTSVGTQFGIQYLFNSAAPITGGWIADTWGLIITFYFIAFILLISNVVVFFIKEGKNDTVVDFEG